MKIFFINTFQFPDTEEKRSELLPTGWNDACENYNIRYVSSRADNLRLQLKGVKAGDMFVFTVFVSLFGEY